MRQAQRAQSDQRAGRPRHCRSSSLAQVSSGNLVVKGGRCRRRPPTRSMTAEGEIRGRRRGGKKPKEKGQDTHDETETPGAAGLTVLHDDALWGVRAAQGAGADGPPGSEAERAIANDCEALTKAWARASENERARANRGEAGEARAIRSDPIRSDPEEGKQSRDAASGRDGTRPRREAPSRNGETTH